jgi:hypothetical protein
MTKVTRFFFPVEEPKKRPHGNDIASLRMTKNSPGTRPGAKHENNPTTRYTTNLVINSAYGGFKMTGLNTYKLPIANAQGSVAL